LRVPAWRPTGSSRPLADERQGGTPVSSSPNFRWGLALAVTGSNRSSDRATYREDMRRAWDRFR